MAKSNAVAVQGEETRALVAADLGGGFEDFAGEGFSEVRAQDLAIPFIRILGAQSPQVNKRDGAYVEGAEAGMFYDTVMNKVYDGEKGIAVVACHYSFKYVEWRPRGSGGGFVASYDVEDGERLMKTTKRPDPVKSEDILPNGNLLVPTAQFYVFVIEDDGSIRRAVIAMTSTQLKKARKWNMQMTSMTAKGARGTYQLPMFANVWRMRTVPESNDKGDWFGWEYSKERQFVMSNPEDAEIVNTAREFTRAVRAGEVKVKEENIDSDAPVANSSAHDDNSPI